MLLKLQAWTKLHVIKKIMTTTSNFKTVYKFPYIRGFGMINRMKWYQTVLTSTALPGVALLKLLDVTTADDILFTVIVGLSGLVPLYGFGYFTNKLVGIVYLNDEKKMVKIAYIDFWGRRKDIEIPLKEIMPFSEVSPSFIDPLYLKVQQYSSKDKLKLCSKYGVLDEKAFNKIFLS